MQFNGVSLITHTNVPTPGLDLMSPGPPLTACLGRSRREMHRESLQHHGCGFKPSKSIFSFQRWGAGPSMCISFSWS